jgi:hypothetical protein
MIEFDENGNIVPDQPTVLTQYNVRFPTEKEQARGITEVPRDRRRKKKAKRDN